MCHTYGANIDTLLPMKSHSWFAFHQFSFTSSSCSRIPNQATNRFELASFFQWLCPMTISQTLLFSDDLDSFDEYTSGILQNSLSVGLYVFLRVNLGLGVWGRKTWEMRSLSPLISSRVPAVSMMELRACELQWPGLRRVCLFRKEFYFRQLFCSLQRGNREEVCSVWSRVRNDEFLIPGSHFGCHFTSPGLICNLQGVGETLEGQGQPSEGGFFLMSSIPCPHILFLSHFFGQRPRRKKGE